jgi:nitrate reductase gamma subunit
MMKFVVHTDVIRVKEFFQGLYVGQVMTLPADPLLLLHLLLVAR